MRTTRTLFILHTALWAVWLLAPALPALAAASEPPRIALVIGNASYERSPALKNPGNDATDMAGKLSKLGFTLVGDGPHLNVRHAQMVQLLRAFREKLQEGDTALFYYAGHGVAVDGKTWLLPVEDQDIQGGADVQYLAMSVEGILAQMAHRGGGINILFLDACRDNALPDRSPAGPRGVPGMKQVPKESFVLYAASEDQVAEDGRGHNGLFTEVLLKLIDQPGLSSDDLRRQILKEVYERSGGRQEPMPMDQLTEPFYFVPVQAALVTPPKPAKPACAYCPEMVAIPAGSFRMGSPDSEDGHDSSEGLHDVHIGYTLAVSKDPVTRGQWREYLADSRRTASGNCWGFNQVSGSDEQKPEYSWSNPGFPQDDDHPVVCVTWQEAADYAAWLSRRTGHHYRLLTEAEYEFVDRAGTSTAYWWGGSDAEACTHANVADATAKARYPSWPAVECTDGAMFTSPVGTFLPNAWKLYDTTGNVWSWVEDCYHSDYNGAPADGRAWGQGQACAQGHVARGGSWHSLPWKARSASRYYNPDSACYIGFRVAMAAD
jgi:formylglycine-generating enzyme required for sulfatase activity